MPFTVAAPLRVQARARRAPRTSRPRHSTTGLRMPRGAEFGRAATPRSSNRRARTRARASRARSEPDAFARSARAPRPRIRRPSARCRHCGTATRSSADAAPCTAATARFACGSGCTTARTGYGSCTPLAAARRGCGGRRSGSSAPQSTASTLPNTSPSSPKNEKFTKLRYRSRLRALCKRVIVQQPRAPIFGERGRERMEQAVEVRARGRRVRQREEALHVIPERVRVQHEARARHDVRPVAGLVLLEQEEALMLLREQPLQRQRDLASVAAQQAARGRAARHRETRGR